MGDSRKIHLIGRRHGSQKSRREGRATVCRDHIQDAIAMDWIAAFHCAVIRGSRVHSQRRHGSRVTMGCATLPRARKARSVASASVSAGSHGERFGLLVLSGLSKVRSMAGNSVTVVARRLLPLWRTCQVCASSPIFSGKHERENYRKPSAIVHIVPPERTSGDWICIRSGLL